MAEEFVGRTVELASLLDVAGDVARGRRATALVTGAPGIGKTRLLHEVARRAEGVFVLRVTGYEPERAVPFAAARDLMRHLAEIPGGATISRLLDSAAEPSRRSTAAALQLRLFEAAHRARDALGPALLVIDDAHWMDPQSAALCHYVLRAADSPASQLGLIMGGRPGAATRTFWAAVRRLDATGGTRIELGPMSREDARRLAHLMAPDINADEREAAYERAAGSPFWLARLLRAGDTNVDEELMGTTADATAALGFLACAARPLPVPELLVALDWDQARGERAIGELVDAGLAVQEHGAVRIAHDLIRDAVVGRTPPDRLRTLRQRVATWLTGRSDELGALMEAMGHLEAAGLPTTELALRVATAPARRLLGEPGLVRLDAVATRCTADEEQCRALNAAVARMAVELGAHDRALARWSTLLSVARREEVAQASLGAARAALELGRRDEAWTHLDRAERAATRPAIRAGVTATRSAVMRYLDHRPRDAWAYAAEALTIARAISVQDAPEASDEAREAHIHALVAATDAALMNDDPVEMLRLADELADLTAVSHPRTHIEALTQGALARRFRGRNQDAEHRLARAWDLARAQVMPQAILEVGALRGVVLLTLGRLDEAEAVIRELLALDRRLAEFRPARAFSHVLPHLLDLSRGDWRHAVEGLREAARREADPHYRLHGYLEHAVAVSRIDPRSGADAVRAAIAEARSDAGDAGCERCRREVAARGAEALGRIGEREAGRRMLTEVDHATRDSAADLAMHWWIERGRAACLDDGPARELLRDLRKQADRQGMVLETIWCDLDLARSQRDHDRAAAAEAARSAGTQAQRIGANTEAQLAERVLRDLGVRTWRRGPKRGSAATALTDRERQMIAMVRTGASNPEIASALFLSRKTVERHLSNAMAKLGVRNRAELAAAADETD